MTVILKYCMLQSKEFSQTATVYKTDICFSHWDWQHIFRIVFCISGDPLATSSVPCLLPCREFISFHTRRDALWFYWLCGLLLGLYLTPTCILYNIYCRLYSNLLAAGVSVYYCEFLQYFYYKSTRIFTVKYLEYLWK